jgi:AbrB family looped-hinge helix DNA binding protein
MWAMAETAHLDARGRVVLPASARRRLGLEPGTELLVLPDARGGVRLVPRRDAARALLGVAAPGEGDSAVEELLAERRREAAAELTDSSPARNYKAR